MKKILIPAALTLMLTSVPTYAAPSALPAPIQAILERIKGEWVVEDKGHLNTRLRFQADGRGQLVDRNGSSEIEWQLEGGKISIRLLTPTETKIYEYIEDENGNGIGILNVTALHSLTLEFHKFDVLRGIIWKMNMNATSSYPDHPEKGVQEQTFVRDQVKLIAKRQFKDFAPQQGQILSLNLPDYQASTNGSAFKETVSLLVRLDAGQVATVLVDHPSGLKQLSWRLEQGSLQVWDGKGYSVSYQQYQGDSVTKRLLADAQWPDREFVAEEPSVLVDPIARGQGFQSQSPIFQGCWETWGDDHCFQRGGLFQFHDAL